MQQETAKSIRFSAIQIVKLCLKPYLYTLDWCPLLNHGMVLSWRWHWVCCGRHSQGLLPLLPACPSLWDTPLAQDIEGLNSLFSSGLAWDNRAGRGEGRWIWPHTQPYNLSLWRQQPCAGVALWWAHTETAESWHGKDGKQHISQSGVPEEGGHARRDPVPGLCMHLDQLQSHLSCLEDTLPLLGLTHKQKHRAHQLTHCTTKSMWKSWETSSSEFPPGRTIIPTYYSQRQRVQHPNLHSACSWTHPWDGQQQCPSTGVRETEHQFKNV